MSVYYKFFRSVFGYSILETDGEAEALLNSLTEKKIYFWGSRITSEGKLQIKGSVFSAGKIIEECEHLGFEAEVIKRKGLPFLAEKYKKRYGIIAGMIIAWAFLFLSSLLVWEVNSAQRSGENPVKIRGYLEQYGVESGTFIPKLNVRAVENQFLIDHPEYSFIALNISGTVVNVELRRATKGGTPEDLSMPSDVIAKKGGTVISVEAFGGSPVVKRGDVVEAGDLLISSFMTGNFGVTRSVHAYGKVKAAVDYEFQGEIPFKYEVTSKTGREERKISLDFLSLTIPFFSNETTSFKKCDVVSEYERLKIFGVKFPFEVEKITYFEEETDVVFLTEGEAEIKAREEYSRWKEMELKGELIEESVEVEFDKKRGVCLISATITVEEDIGETVVIG